MPKQEKDRMLAGKSLLADGSVEVYYLVTYDDESEDIVQLKDGEETKFKEWKKAPNG